MHSEIKLIGYIELQEFFGTNGRVWGYQFKRRCDESHG